MPLGGHLPVLKPGPLALLQCEGWGWYSGMCGSQASHPSCSHCIPSPCPIMPTSATRASHCRPYIMSHCPECPACPSPIPGPWVDMGNTYSTLGVGVQGRQRFGPQSLVLRSTNPTSVPPTRNLTTVFGSFHHFPSWMGASVCLEMTLGTSVFFFFLKKKLKCLPPRPDSLLALSWRQPSQVPMSWHQYEQSKVPGQGHASPIFRFHPSL